MKASDMVLCDLYWKRGTFKETLYLMEAKSYAKTQLRYEQARNIKQVTTD